MNETTPGVNIALIEALRAEAAALEAQAQAKRAQAEALESATQRTELLDVEQARDEYHAGRGALLAAAQRGELTLVRGARRRLMIDRAELERWIRSRKVTPRKPEPAAADLDTWEAQADRSLRALNGGRQ